MAKFERNSNDNSNSHDSEYDSEGELPFDGPIEPRGEAFSVVKPKANELTIPEQEKPIVFSSNRRMYKKKMELLPKNEPNIKDNNENFKYAYSSKEPSTQSISHDKKNSMFSISNKISERPEFEEESSNTDYLQRKTPELVKNMTDTTFKKLGKNSKVLQLEEIEEEPKIGESDELSHRGLLFVLIVIVATNILINVDHGGIPACTIRIKKDLNIDNASLGVLGSVVYVGLLGGSFLSPPLFHFFSVKKIIMLGTFLNSIGLVGFTMFADFYVLGFFRFWVGFFQVLLGIYFPVWIDVFGKDSEKTIWLTILQSGVPLGVVIGYGMTAIFEAELDSWRLSYHLQAVVFIALTIMFMGIPIAYVEDQTIDDESDHKNKIKDEIEDNFIPEDDSNYLSDSESDDGYEGEMSSKYANSSKHPSKK